MTQITAPPRTTSTLPPPSASGFTRSPPAPRPAERTRLRARLTGMRTMLIAALAAFTVAVIFIIQNVHAANISFLGVHLVLPLAAALLLAAVVGSLLTVAAGPARITRLRQIMRRGLRKAVPAKQASMTAASPLQGKSAGRGREAPHASDVIPATQPYL